LFDRELVLGWPLLTAVLRRRLFSNDNVDVDDDAAEDEVDEDEEAAEDEDEVDEDEEAVEDEDEGENN
jgi:beta-lactam-binding protein with PASTA domain